MNRSGAGNRKKTFDYNFDGFAHIGMYPDFIQDLKTIRSTGITDDDLRPLFSSAEAYVNMWERAEDRSLAANTGPE